MKLYKNVLILLAVLVVLGGALFLIQAQNGGQGKLPEATPDKGVSITNYDKWEVEEITIVTADRTYIIGSKDETLYWKAPAGFVLNDSKASDYGASVVFLSASKKIDTDIKADSIYGLDKPIRITLKMKGMAARVFDLGGLTPYSDGYYLREKGINTIYVIGKITGDQLKLNLNDIVTLDIFTGEPGDIKAFDLKKNGKMSFAMTYSEGLWDLTAPVKGLVKEKTATAIIETLQDLKKMGVKSADVKDLGKYGLINPAYELSITFTKMKYTLMIGNKDVSTGETYAKLAGSNEIFTIESSLLDFVDTAPADMMEDYFFTPFLTNMIKIEAKIGDWKSVTNITINEADRDKDIITVDGKNVTNLKNSDESLIFSEYYQALITISKDQILPDAKPVYKPEVYVKFTKANGNVQSIGLVPYGKTLYYVFIDEKYSGIVAKSGTYRQNILNMYKKLMDAAK